jgi:hypothetical protein
VDITKFNLCKCSALQDKNQNTKAANKIIEKCGKAQIFQNDSSNSKLHSERNEDQIKLGNSCYHALQHILYPRLLPKNVKIQIYRIITFLYGRETKSLT